MAGMGISSMVSVSAVRSPRVIEEEVAEEETDLMVFPFFRSSIDGICGTCDTLRWTCLLIMSNT